MTLSPLAWITQCPREFDFGCGPDFPQFHYAGPFHDGRGRMNFDFPWQQLTGEPIVYASMGTLQNGLVDIFRSITQAAIGLKELQFVLAVGGHLDPKQLGAVPANVIVVNHAPQIEVLKRTSLCITHAGLNTVLESLSNGVPMVALPVTNDQPGVAARIADKKVGVVMAPDQASPGNFVASIKRCLKIPRSGITFGECRKQSAEQTVFPSPQVFLREHLSWERGSRGRPKRRLRNAQAQPSAYHPEEHREILVRI